MQVEETLRKIQLHSEVNTSALLELAKIIEEMRAQQAAAACPWMTSEEAASYLGIDTSKSNYRRKLSYLVKFHGLVPSDSREPKYLRTSVMRILDEIQTGLIGQISYA